jgi:deazaflavin-dependent oxidoreductase (nitroreductase family)
VKSSTRHAERSTSSSPTDRLTAAGGARASARTPTAVPEAVPVDRVHTVRMSTVQHLVRSIAAPLSRTRLFRAVAPAALPHLERLLRRMSRGRVQVSGLLVPTLVLHSTGAKSGRPRETVLMYTPDGRGRAIVAGTSFARDKHPAWTYNLMVHPEADIDVRGRRLHVRAALLGPKAREDAWQRIEKQWPGYRGYERDSGRVVRLFLLQPVSSAPPGGTAVSPTQSESEKGNPDGRNSQ